MKEEFNEDKEFLKNIQIDIWKTKLSRKHLQYTGST
jgi:hypothetical protein